MIMEMKCQGESSACIGLDGDHLAAQDVDED